MCVIIICGWFSFRAKLSISFRFRCLALCDCVTACCCVYANVCEDVSDDAYVGFAVCSFFFLFISSPFPFLWDICSGSRLVWWNIQFVFIRTCTHIALSIPLAVLPCQCLLHANSIWWCRLQRGATPTEHKTHHFPVSIQNYNRFNAIHFCAHSSRSSFRREIRLVRLHRLLSLSFIIILLLLLFILVLLVVVVLGVALSRRCTYHFYLCRCAKLQIRKASRVDA